MSLTDQGFVRRRFDEIVLNLSEKFQNALGPVKVDADSVTGQIINIFSIELADLEEVMQDVYDSMYPSTAEGTSLDGAVSFIGIERLSSEPTTVPCVCYGKEGTVVSKNAIASSFSGYNFLNTKAIVITRTNCVDLTISVPEVIANTNYLITIDGTTYSYSAQLGDSKETILNALKSSMSAPLIATLDSEQLNIKKSDKITSFSFYASETLKIESLGTLTYFDCVETGAIPVPVGDVNKVVSQLSGWEEIYNPVPGDTGRNRETDIELRERYYNSVRISGAATAESIIANLINDNPTVSYAKIYENRSNYEKDGMPPHSFEIVVTGGTDQEIAETIYKYKPAGIETHGNVSRPVEDINGDEIIIKFSRAISVPIYVRVTVLSLTDEEELTDSLASAIISAVLTYGNSLQISQDVFYQRFYGPIFSNTSGVENIKVEVSTDGTTYKEDDISIGKAEQATFSDSRISVIGV